MPQHTNQHCKTNSNKCNLISTVKLTRPILMMLQECLRLSYTPSIPPEQQVVYTDPNEAVRGTLEVVEGVVASPKQLKEMSTFTYDTAQWYNPKCSVRATERNLTSKSNNCNHTF